MTLKPEDLREKVAREAEAIILRRLYRQRIEGYTLDMSQEIADAILALLSPADGWRLVPEEPTEAMLKAAFVAMNETPSGTWKRLKAEGQAPRRIFDVKMAPRYRAMIAAAPRPPGARDE